MNNEKIFVGVIHSPSGNIFAKFNTRDEFLNYYHDYKIDNNLSGATWSGMEIYSCDILKIKRDLFDCETDCKFHSEFYCNQIKELEEKLEIVSTGYNELIKLLNKYDNARYKLQVNSTDSSTDLSSNTLSKNIGYFLGSTQDIYDRTICSSAYCLINDKYNELPF